MKKQKPLEVPISLRSYGWEVALSPGINLSHTFFVEQLLFECTRDLLCNKTVEWLHFMVVSCVWLCDPMDCSPSISSVHRAFQARLPEWGDTSYSRGSSRPRHWTCVSCISCISEGFFITSAPGKPNFISWAASNHKTREALSTEDWMEFFTSFSASPRPTILPSHISRTSHNLDSTALHPIQIPLKTRPHGSLADSPDDQKFFYSFYETNNCSLLCKT